ncbi:hypothetical protein G4D82_08470 [Flavobacterium sp. CYK-4]|uniref:hypothetical protein n=1 Tax=Flavobacterium lotistagni TaxID=2709660 RepID=UPI00140C00FD|nr:hypothetical protein [Flavobacterium lotistagni]NHM07251.1 hypothetical protein [Flavobacterium lotistagni]
MELDKIEQLLEKYFEGETTLAEEQQLKNYFSSAVVASHLQQYQPLFGYYAVAAQEKPQQEFHLKSNQNQPLKWISIAASVVILLGVGFFAFNHFSAIEKPSSELGTYDDPQQAFEQTQKALAMLSKQVNVGIGSMQYVQQYENTKDQIFITE